MTVVQPAASAAPSLRVIMAEGKFHGVKIDLRFKKSALRGISQEVFSKRKYPHDSNRLFDDEIS